jgi:hypothetical protein
VFVHVVLCQVLAGQHVAAVRLAAAAAAAAQDETAGTAPPQRITSHCACELNKQLKAIALAAGAGMVVPTCGVLAAA